MKVEVRIKGVSPLLMSRFTSDGGDGAPKPMVNKRDEVEAAESRAYRIVGGKTDSNLYVPAECLRQALVNGAAYEKGRGRSSLSKFAAATIFVEPIALDLGTSKYEIDSRPVVIAATKGRIMRHRPRLDLWSLDFTIEFDSTMISEGQMRAIVDHAGSKVGLLDFRPEKKGPYGRFMVTEWKSEDK